MSEEEANSQKSGPKSGRFYCRQSISRAHKKEQKEKTGNWEWSIVFFFFPFLFRLPLYGGGGRHFRCTLRLVLCPIVIFLAV